MNRINYASGWPPVLTIDHENHRFLGRCAVIVRVKSHKIHVLTRTQVTTCRQCAWHRLQRWPACVEETNVVWNQLRNLTRGYHNLSVRIIIFLSYLDVMYVCTKWHYFKCPIYLPKSIILFVMRKNVSHNPPPNPQKPPRSASTVKESILRTTKDA